MSLYPSCHLKKKKGKTRNSYLRPVLLPNKEPRRDQEHWNRGGAVAEEISTAQEGAGVFPKVKGQAASAQDMSTARRWPAPGFLGCPCLLSWSFASNIPGAQLPTTADASLWALLSGSMGQADS